MKYLFLACLFTVFTLKVKAQIVSTSASDLYIDSLGWQGKIDLYLYNTQNVANVFNFVAGSQFQHLKGRHRLLSVNAITQMIVHSDGTNSNDDKGVQHFRYNYIVNKRWEFESFLQGQYNEPLRIGFRGLLGAGARMVFHKNAKDYFYAGLGPMFDHEREIGNGIITNEMRANAYVALKRSFNEKISSSLNVYYQPQIGLPSDYRISIGGTLKITASKHIGLKTVLNLNYDSSPVEDPNILSFTYTFVTGFFYKF